MEQLAQALASTPGPKPKLFQACGSEDSLLGCNRRFRDFITPLGFDYHYEESPGLHDWAYWDAGIQRILSWLPRSR